MDSIKDNKDDTDDNNYSSVIVTEIQNIQQVYELWNKTWTESEDYLKVAFLYHYFALHLRDELFYLIGNHGESYAMTWDNHKFRNEKVQIKVFTPKEAYTLNIKEMKNELYEKHAMIVGCKLLDNSGIVHYNLISKLKFNHSISPTTIILSELYEIEENFRPEYLIVLSDKIYQKQAVPEELFTYISNISRCQLFVLTTMNNLNFIWNKTDKSIKEQRSQMQYITKLMHHILSQSVLTPLFNEIIPLVKLLLNIIPLDYNDKINFINMNIKETQLNFNNTTINQWLNKNKKLYTWASNYIVKRVNNEHLKNIILQTVLCNSETYNDIEKSQFKSILELVHNYNIVYKNIFNFSTFTDTARAKRRRSKNKPRKNTESNKRISASTLKTDKTPNNKKITLD